MDGAGIRWGKSLCLALNRRGGRKTAALVIVICPALTFFSEKGMATAQHSPQVLTELNQN